MASNLFWHNVLEGAAGDFAGGLAATLLWFIVLTVIEKRRTCRELQGKRESLSLEFAKVHSQLDRLRDDPDTYTALSTGGGQAVITALIRAGPKLATDASLEPLLANFEQSMRALDIVSAKYTLLSTGIAVALRNADEDKSELRTRLASLIESAQIAVRHLETAVVKTT